MKYDFKPFMIIAMGVILISVAPFIKSFTSVVFFIFMGAVFIGSGLSLHLIESRQFGNSVKSWDEKND